MCIICLTIGTLCLIIEKNTYGGKNMLEYQTLRVYPDQEAQTIRTLAKYGWKHEETREVFNQNDQLVGISAQSYTAYYDNGYGKTDSRYRLETQTNTTHFLSMRFSRDTSLKNYARLKELEQIDPMKDLPELKQEIKLTEKPVGFTVVLTLIAVFVTAIALSFILWENNPGLYPALIIPVIAVGAIAIKWTKYLKAHPKEIAELEEIKKYNEETAKSNSEIVKRINTQRNEEIKQIMIENGYGEYWE